RLPGDVGLRCTRVAEEPGDVVGDLEGAAEDDGVLRLEDERDGGKEAGLRLGAEAGEGDEAVFAAGVLELGEVGDAEALPEGTGALGAEAGDAKEIEQAARNLASNALEGLEGAGGEDL